MVCRAVQKLNLNIEFISIQLIFMFFILHMVVLSTLLSTCLSIVHRLMAKKYGFSRPFMPCSFTQTEGLCSYSRKFVRLRLALPLPTV